MYKATILIDRNGTLYPYFTFKRLGELEAEDVAFEFAMKYVHSPIWYIETLPC